MEIPTDSKKLPTEYFFLLPIAGSAVAIAFDVGVFYGVAIDFFSAFSLSEHIAFALEAIPIAIVILIIAAIEIGVLNVLDRRRDSEKRRWRRLIIYVILLTLLIAYMFWTQFFLAGIIGALSLILLITGDFIRRWIFAIFSVAMFALMLSFFWGYSLGKHVHSANRAYHVVYLGSESVNAILIRLGERGVLVFDVNAREVVLLPWSGITKITTAK